MELLERLTADMKTAMKAGDKGKLGIVRMLISEVRMIDLQPSKPTAQQAVEGYAKKLRKSADEFDKVGRGDEAKALRDEVAVVETYLPKKKSAEETAGLVDAFLAANPFTEKDAGRATGQFMKQHGPDLDAGIASGLIRQKLAGK